MISVTTTTCCVLNLNEETFWILLHSDWLLWRAFSPRQQQLRLMGVVVFEIHQYNNNLSLLWLLGLLWLAAFHCPKDNKTQLQRSISVYLVYLLHFILPPQSPLFTSTRPHGQNQSFYHLSCWSTAALWYFMPLRAELTRPQQHSTAVCFSTTHDTATGV